MNNPLQGGTIARLLPGVLCGLASCLALAQPDTGYYEQVAESRGLGGVTGYGRGASFVDVDGDGDDDLFVADTDGRLFGAPYGLSMIYTNDGRGNFVPGEFNLDPDDFHGTWAGSFADFDNDGDQDMLVANGGYTNRSTLELLENRINQGQGFVNVTIDSGMGSETGQQDTYSWWGVSWADYDNDGWLDVAVTRRGARPLVFHNDGDGSFRERGEALGLSDYGHRDAKNPVWIDYDQDGDQDLYLAGMDWHGFFRNDGDSFSDITNEIFPQALEGHSGLPAVFAAASADFDQDGLEDIYLGRWDSQDLVLFNNGNGGFDVLGRDNGIDSINYEPVAANDTNPMSNRTAAQRAQERADSPSGAETTMAPFENTMGLGVGDFFDDGYPDIVIGTGNPRFNAADVFFCNLGARRFQRCSERFLEPDGSHRMTRAHGAAFADVDRDGQTDFFFNLGGHPPYDFNQKAESRETNKLFMRQSGPAANAAWITLTGTSSNRDAIGARVKYGEGDAARYHFLRSTAGFQSQNSRTLLLPMGELETIPVSINWPSGRVTELNISAGQNLVVIEE